MRIRFVLCFFALCFYCLIFCFILFCEMFGLYVVLIYILFCHLPFCPVLFSPALFCPVIFCSLLSFCVVVRFVFDLWQFKNFSSGWFWLPAVLCFIELDSDDICWDIDCTASMTWRDVTWRDVAWLDPHPCWNGTNPARGSFLCTRLKGSPLRSTL